MDNCTLNVPYAWGSDAGRTQKEARPNTWRVVVVLVAFTVGECSWTDLILHAASLRRTLHVIRLGFSDHLPSLSSLASSLPKNQGLEPFACVQK
ncbi:hypothetical protein [Pseudomonas canadensis]|uniref:Transposase n=1 Tax=Pseudomonas canadensis TaxID=915099 RepID=A0ABZ0ZZ41_9PSED|nr:hypothetical protein [Pseudomonas canadensis]MCF5171143.1 hypothetical protein [Pseudomonas canadensis]WNJ83053.1 hypothetical protein RMQ99_18235 [Pseudomonas canadensis]WRI22380.1 hypothetical protein SPL95_17350 [Pseudomonas canadensis]